MFEKIKAAIKSLPFLYKILFSCATIFRRTKSRLTGKIEELDRFRQYCQTIPKLVPEPLFVKVGANDGISGDPCSDILLAEATWRGLLIEPVPYCFDRLKANFSQSQRFFLEQLAIGPTQGRINFYYVDHEKALKSIPNLPPWFDQLGSFDRSHIVKQLNGVLEPFIIECPVEVCALSEVLKKYRIRDVHLLHIDTEGYDFEVLKTLDFSTHAPLLILIEHKHVPADYKIEMLHFLSDRGYAVRDCGGDYFAVNKKAYKRLKMKRYVSRFSPSPAHQL